MNLYELPAAVLARVAELRECDNIESAHILGFDGAAALVLLMPREGLADSGGDWARPGAPVLVEVRARPN